MSKDLPFSEGGVYVFWNLAPCSRIYRCFQENWCLHHHGKLHPI